MTELRNFQFSQTIDLMSYHAPDAVGFDVGAIGGYSS